MMLKITMRKLLTLLTLNAFIVLNIFAQVATIDVSKAKQVIDGFGACTAWHVQFTSAEADAAFKNENSEQIGLSILRVRIAPSSTEWPGWADEKANAQKAKARGAMILASPWSPPTSMKTNNNIIGGELKPESYSAYANHLKTFCTYLGNVDVVSIQNEPNIEVGYESCNWTPAQLLAFCKNNASAIGKPVMAPEAFNFDKNYSDPILNDSTANSHVQYIGGHLYGATAYNYSNAITRGKKVWMTEKYFNPDDIATCITMAKEITDCMYYNMNAYVWWYLRQPGCNLIEAGGKLKKKGCTMGQFSKFVRPGYFRVEATYQPKTGVYMVAFKGKDQNVVVVVNQNKIKVSQSFSFKNDTIFSVKKYVTSDSKNINDEGTITCAVNSFSDNLDAQSITTYVSSKIPTASHSLKVPEIRIFPNPASKYLQLTTVEGVTDFRIFNILGQPLISKTNPETPTIDITGLNSGLYLIRIRQDGSDQTFRFIKK
jgi:glucuronoarabinoxylan endo-1,4-beta-xylanase